MPPKAHQNPITLHDYHQMIERGILGRSDRVELIHGEIIEMSPIGTKHNFTVDLLTRILVRSLPDTATVRVQGSVCMNDLSEPEPDFVVYKTGNYLTENPWPKDIHLVIEVADSSLQYDREVKMPLYSAAGIPEFWLVNLQTDTLEVYRSPKGNQYTEREEIGPDEVVTDGSLGLRIPADAFLGLEGS